MQSRWQETKIPVTWNAQLLPFWFTRSHTIARRWYEEILPLADGVTELDEAQRFLHEQTEQIIALLLEEPLDRAAARLVGALLAERFWAPQVIGRTQQLLPSLLLEGVPAAQSNALRGRIMELLGEMVVGFIEEKERSLRSAHHTFLSHMRHELGSPLTSVTGFAYIILAGMDGPLTERQAADIRAIQEASQHLVELLNDIGDVSKVEMKRVRFQPQRFEIQPLLASVERGLQDILGKNENRLCVQVEASVGQLSSDKKKLERLLRALVSHANWSTRQDELQLRASTESIDGEAWLHLSLRDHGVGLTVEQLEGLRHPCADHELALALESGGPGLSLLLCRCLTTLLKGRFEVKSEVGEGTQYDLWFPVEYTPPAKGADKR